MRIQNFQTLPLNFLTALYHDQRAVTAEMPHPSAQCPAITYGTPPTLPVPTHQGIEKAQVLTSKENNADNTDT